MKKKNRFIERNFQFEAMALEMPSIEQSLNRTPFSGILARVDQPSDLPVGGAKGHKTFISKAEAEKALPSLLGMGVGCHVELTEHNPQKKIGVITEACVEGDALMISGILYEKDFPTEVSEIQERKQYLGFSYEATGKVRNPQLDPWILEDIIFTGAAILWKENAAYQTTELAAKAEQEEVMENMDLLEQLVADMNDMKEQIITLTNTVANLVKEETVEDKPDEDSTETETDTKASREVTVVQPHSDTVITQPDLQSSVIRDEIESLKTRLADFEAKAVVTSTEPVRKTKSPEVIAMLRKYDLESSDDKMSLLQVDAALTAAGVKGQSAIEAKLRLRDAGLLT